MWVPELRFVEGDRVHRPWELSEEEQQRFGVGIGVDYPLPMVPPWVVVGSKKRG